MIKVVLDTNVLVSALLTPAGNAGRILNLALDEKLAICLDDRILKEYAVVLRRRKFSFPAQKIDEILDMFVSEGVPVVALPSQGVFPDEADRKFHEVAKTAEAFLITGNGRHFPAEPFVVSPKEFLDRITG
jgi:putative PIN family toxin of toxin-antitoxin system